MPQKRLLYSRAGSPSGNNLTRALKAGDPRLFIVGCDDSPFAIKKSLADRNYLIPDISHDGFTGALRRIVQVEQIDLLIRNSDGDVLAVSRLSHELGCRTFLPSAKSIEVCQDKHDLTQFLSERGLPTPATLAIDSLDEIEHVFEQLGSHSTLWCRARRGAGSTAALPVERPDQVRAWIRYWEDMRGMKPASFTLSEYPPGRDFMVQCLLKNGTPIAAKMFERLSYHGAEAAPSGTSSSAAISKMVFESRVVQTAINAMLAVEPEASCVFFADLKENTAGVACITEINAGRFSNMPTIHDSTGRRNMCLAYVHAAFDEPIEAHERFGYVEDCYVMRERDMLPVVLNKNDLFDGFEDAR